MENNDKYSSEYKTIRKEAESKWADWKVETHNVNFATSKHSKKILRLVCDCGKDVSNPYSLADNFEYVGTDEENNPIFKCKDCGVDVWG